MCIGIFLLPIIEYIEFKLEEFALFQLGKSRTLDQDLIIKCINPWAWQNKMKHGFLADTVDTLS